MYRRRSEAAAPMPTHLPWNRAVWVVALIATLAIGLGAQVLIGRLLV